MAQLGWAGTLSYSDQAVSAAPAAGSTTHFTLNGQPITVTIPAAPPAPVATAHVVALATQTAINLLTPITGVRAEIGGGIYGGLTDSIVFMSDSSDIKVTNYNEPPLNDILGFSNFEKLGVGAADETPGDGQLEYNLSDRPVYNSLMGLDYADTLKTDGNSFDLFLYKKDGTLALAQPVTIDLTRAYTLQDVATAINNSIMNATNTTSPWVEASVVANQLVLRPDDTHNFAFGNDSSNFLAAMGVNTFFSGHNASTIGINQMVSGHLDNLAAGAINEFGEIFKGDNSNALSITNIQRDENITYNGQGSSTDTLDGFYNSLIAEIGLKGKSINTDLEYNTLVYDQLSEMRDATSGVSLDEEMANLIKFQHAYSAAAKLISISDEMLQTLLATVK